MHKHSWKIKIKRSSSSQGATTPRVLYRATFVYPEISRLSSIFGLFADFTASSPKPPEPVTRKTHPTLIIKHFKSE